MVIFKHKTPIQIRFKDMDALNHVNNANHITYFELARVKYFDDVVSEEVNWSEKGIILASISVQYKIPVLLKDKISVYTKCTRLGNKSFDLTYSLVKEMNEKEIELATGSSVQVCFDYRNQATTPIPESWRKKVNAFEGI
jgi:acyl-CoA thioester hydrolase